MTNEQPSRIDRIEALVESNARTIQAMLEQQATDRLRHEEQMKELRNGVIKLEAVSTQLTEVQQGMVGMLAAVDETQPTILRKLNSIENKIDRLSQNQ